VAVSHTPVSAPLQSLNTRWRLALGRCDRCTGRQLKHACTVYYMQAAMSRIERNGAPALALVRTAPQPAAAQTRPPRRPPAARPRRAAGMRARATSRPRTRAVCWSRSTACTPRASRRCGCRRRRWPTWRGARARRLRTRPCWVKCARNVRPIALPALSCFVLRHCRLWGRPVTPARPRCPRIRRLRKPFCARCGQVLLHG